MKAQIRNRRGIKNGGKKQDAEHDYKKEVKMGLIFIQRDVNEMHIPSRAASRSFDCSSDTWSPEEGGPASSSRKLLRLAQQASGHHRKPIFQYMRQRSLVITSPLLNESFPHCPGDRLLVLVPSLAPAGGLPCLLYLGSPHMHGGPFALLLPAPLVQTLRRTSSLWSQVVLSS